MAPSKNINNSNTTVCQRVPRPRCALFISSDFSWLIDLAQIGNQYNCLSGWLWRLERGSNELKSNSARKIVWFITQAEEMMVIMIASDVRIVWAGKREPGL